MRNRSALVAIALLLSSCGGGGSGSDPRALEPLPGLDPYLDRLLAQCEADDVESCARLILEDGPSVYVERALAALQGGGEGGAAVGDDSASRLLACESGDIDVCAELYLEAPAGSEVRERAFAGLLGAGGSESGGSSTDTGSGRIDPDGESFFGDVTLVGGFEPDPYLIELTAGGANDATQLSGACAGYVGSRPDVRLVFEAGVLPLNIFAYAEGEDLTLVVRDPSGRYRCNDDFDGLDPAVLIGSPTSGTYEIWVGVWGDAGEFAAAVLAISELDPVFP